MNFCDDFFSYPVNILIYHYAIYQMLEQEVLAGRKRHKLESSLSQQVRDVITLEIYHPPFLFFTINHLHSRYLNTSSSKWARSVADRQSWPAIPLCS